MEGTVLKPTSSSIDSPTIAGLLRLRRRTTHRTYPPILPEYDAIFYSQFWLHRFLLTARTSLRFQTIREYKWRHSVVTSIRRLHWKITVAVQQESLPWSCASSSSKLGRAEQGCSDPKHSYSKLIYWYCDPTQLSRSTRIRYKTLLCIIHTLPLDL